MTEASTWFRRYRGAAAGLLALAGLYLVSLYSYLLFHSLVEMTGVAITCGVFLLAWNARRFQANNYLLFAGIGYLFVSIVILLHTLAYRGMGVFRPDDADLPTQLWLAARYLESLTLLIAPLFLRRRLNVAAALLIYTAVVTLLFVALFPLRIFPVAYVEGVGLTLFKVASEYLICLIFLAALGLLYRNRAAFDPDVRRLLGWSIVAAIACELSFTLYTDVYGVFNLLGHYFRLISVYLVYRALIQTGLVRPYDLLFRDLKQSETDLRAARDELEQRVRARTAELSAANEQLRVLHQVDQAILAAQSPSAIAQTAIRHIQRGIPCRRISLSLAPCGPGEDQDFGAPTAAESEEVLAAGGAAGGGGEDAAQCAAGRHSLPLQAGGQVIGRLDLWPAEPRALSSGQLEFLAQVADSLAVAIQNARLFAQVQASREELQALSHRLVEVQENERRAIARELHDEASQSLTALKLGLGFLEGEVPDTPSALNRIADLRHTVDGVLDGLHRLAMNLRPPSLDRSGLVPALSQYIDSFGRQANLAVDFVTIGLDGDRLPPDVETTLYRVVQEALTNVARHAHARNVGVVLERRGPPPGRAVAIIEDDGVGFDVTDAMRRGRLGLIGMRERAEMLGGALTVQSMPGAGTTLFVEVPAGPV